MSSSFDYRISNDGGVTWTAPMPNVLPGVYGQDGDTTFAFDSKGRLFYAYQGFQPGHVDEFVARLNPVTGAYISGPSNVSIAGGGGEYDKGTIAADRFAASPFADRLYMVFNEFPAAGGTRVMTSYSTDQGATWSTLLPVSVSTEGFVWPAHIAVAPNGDVYVSYHSQTGFVTSSGCEGIGNPDGISGKVYVVRSTDGGVSFPQKTLAYVAGAADVTYNIQSCPGAIPNTEFWLQGSGEAWVLPDPTIPGNVYVVANDDPDNNHASGDASNIYISRSTNNGLTWGSPIRVDHDTGTNLQVMPTAAIDDITGQISVMWYDNRLGGTNSGGNWLLNVFYTVSTDHGLTFASDVKINDVPFDPDLGAPPRFPGTSPTFRPTLRIGEYNGIATRCGDIQMIWCGNTATGQQAITDSFVSATTISPYCFGDGSLATACPCANNGATGHGCENSSTTGGAVLAGCGTTTPDAVKLISSGELPNAISTLLQSATNFSSGAVFGDGVSCLNGTIRTLYTKTASFGFVTYPAAGDLSITAQSAALGDTITPGSTRYYQVQYRDQVAAFCPNPPGNAWNVSNAMKIVW